LFGKFGEVDTIEIPFRKGGGGVTLGIAYVNFKDTEAAISSYASLDKSYFQGRKLHIMPSQKKPPKEERPERTQEEIDEWKRKKDEARESEFKDQKSKTLKLNFDEETNWNYLFMNQDTVATSMAKKLGISKSSLLDRDSSNIAVKMAQSETIIVNQTKEWMKDNGIDIDMLEKQPRSSCQRSKTVLLVKNIPYSTKEKDLTEIFSRYGSLVKSLISPFNTLAIIEYENSHQAKSAAKNLAYYKINFIMPIYLEFAPEGMISENLLNEKDSVESEQEEQDAEDKASREKTVFIKNLNFTTTEE